jgi:hypothetical protein
LQTPYLIPIYINYWSLFNKLSAAFLIIILFIFNLINYSMRI